MCDWNAVISTVSAIGTCGAAICAWRAASSARKAAQISKQSFVEENRPWLSVKPKICSDLRISNNGVSIVIEFKIKNIGHAPAYNITKKDYLTLTSEGVSSKFNRFRSDFVGNTSHKDKSSLNLLPNESTKIKCKMFFEDFDKEKTFSLCFMLCISYFSKIDNKYHYYCLLRSILEKNNNPYLISNLSVSRELYKASELDLYASDASSYVD